MMQARPWTKVTTGLAGMRWRHLHLVLPLAFFALMLLFYPFRETFEMDLDEGGTVMKALLVARGYPLYSQVWSDQPPLSTYLLAACIRIFGPDVDAGRILVLSLSTALMAAAVHFLRSQWGGWHAVAGAVLIFLLPYYNALSVSIMIGLPAIALAMSSLLALSFWHQRRGRVWLFLSALGLCLSVATKLFTGFLAPIFALGILLDERRRVGSSAGWRKWIGPGLSWSLIFFACVLIVAVFFIGPSNLVQLITPHLASRQVEEFIVHNEQMPLSFYLSDAWPILILGGVGSLFVLLERRWISLYLIAWAGLGTVLLMQQIPVFYHQQLLITVPAAILAAIAAGEGLRLVPRLIRSGTSRRWRDLLAILALAGFGIVLFVRVPMTLPVFRTQPVFVAKEPLSPWPQQAQLFLAKMANHAQETRWVVTDLPMYAFRVNLISPPYLSFITAKRLSTGELTEDKIIAVIQEYRPEQVLIGRREFPKVKQFLQEDYRLIYERGKRFLYLRNDLKGQ